MQLRPVRIEITGDDHAGAAPLTGSGPVSSGPLEVSVAVDEVGAISGWQVANRGDAPVRPRGVSVVLGVHDVEGPLRLVRNGYQSWSPCSSATFGIDHDPSLDNTSGIELLQQLLQQVIATVHIANRVDPPSVGDSGTINRSSGLFFP